MNESDSLKALASLDAFVRWINARFTPEVDAVAGRAVAELFAGDAVSYFEFITGVEELCREAFPTPLIEACLTVDDWYWFAATKAQHHEPRRGS